MTNPGHALNRSPGRASLGISTHVTKSRGSKLALSSLATQRAPVPSAPNTLNGTYGSYLRLINRKYPPLADVFTATATGFGTGTSSHDCPVVLQDGRVYLIPDQSTTAQIYDPDKDTITTAGGTWPGTAGAFAGGCLLDDGRVFAYPLASTSARIYDPASDTLSTPSPAFPGGSYTIYGGCKMVDGRVFICPCNNDFGRIYNPFNDTLTTTVGYHTGSGFRSAWSKAMPDGRILHAPHNHTSMYIYDPASNSAVSIPGFPGSSAHAGLLLLPNGTYYISVMRGLNARIFNPRNNEVTVLPGNFPNTPDAMAGAKLMLDGRIFHANLAATAPRIHDLSLGTLTTLTTLTGSDYRNCALLNDGRIFLNPYDVTSAQIYGNRITQEIPSGRNRGSWVNHL